MVNQIRKKGGGQVERKMVEDRLVDFRQARLHVASGNSTLVQAPQTKFCDYDPFNSEKTLMAFFSPLASGRWTIPTRAPVKSDL